MFCEVAGAAALAAQLDPEDWHDVITIYQEACSAIVQRFSGYIARQVGESLLVYFGYPQPHDEAPQQAVHAGLALIAVLPGVNARIQDTLGSQLTTPLQIRIGIHTGIAVVGEMGNKDYTESTALGETLNIAARFMTLAAANALVIGEHTYRLVHDQFTCVSRGTHSLKGISTPVLIYQVTATRNA